MSNGLREFDGQLRVGDWPPPRTLRFARIRDGRVWLCGLGATVSLRCVFVDSDNYLPPSAMLAHSREALLSLFTPSAAPLQQRAWQWPGECCGNGLRVVYCGAWIGFGTWWTYPQAHGRRSRPGWPSW